MKKIFFTLISLVAFSVIGCSTIDVAMSKKVDVTKKMKKIVVFPFDIKEAKWGDEFSDAITHHFFKSGKVDIVDREALDKVLREQRLTMAGVVDETKAARIGKLLGADVIIIGRGTFLSKREFMGMGKEIPNLIDTFTIKAISVETGSLLFTVRKEPGAAWDIRYRTKYCCGLTMIWSEKDVLVESSRYDDIAKQVVARVLEAIDEIEKGIKLK